MLRKLFTIVGSIALLFNSFAAPLVVLAQDATATPAATSTPTPADTSTPQSTGTPTATPTATVVPTPTDTSTPLSTSTPTATPTISPTDTATPTVTPTITPTAFPSSTPAVTLSPSADPTIAPSATPVLTTDKSDYNPGQTATITGKFFKALQNLVVKIFGGSATDGTYTESNFNVTTDATGGFSLAYVLDSIFRPLYTVQTFDASGTQLAQTTFTDSNPQANLEQCHNGNGTTSFVDCVDPNSPGNTWGSGNANSGNARLFEGNSQNYRLILTNMTTGVLQTVKIGQQYTKGDKMAYDFPTGPGNLGTATTPIGLAGVFPCDDNSGGILVTPCDHSVPSTTTAGKIQIPVIGSGIIPNSTVGNLTIAAQTTFQGVSETTPPTRSPQYMYIYGATPGSFGPYDFSGTSANVDTGDTDLNWSFSFTPTSPTVVVTWGAHVSHSTDYSSISKGTAFNITGSPYHTFLISTTFTSGGAAQDMQMAGSALVETVTPTVTTQAQNASNTDITNQSVSAGTVVHDHATVDTGSASITIPTGSTFTFNLYPNSSCSGAPTSTQTGVSVPSGSQTGSANSNTFTPAVGSYGYIASFVSGNTATVANATGVCEPFTIISVTPTVTTAVHNATHQDITGTSVALGSTVHDSVTVSGTSGTPTGNVTFDFFNNGTCANAPAATSGNVALSGGTADATGFPQGPLGAGSYSFKAHYAGATPYVAADGSCEQVTVSKAQLAISTTVHDASHATIANGAHVPLGTVAHDNATVTGGVSGFTIPAISFTLNSNPITNGSTESGFNATSIATSVLAAGSYIFKASVGSDSNYTGATSSDEPFTVDKAQLSITTTVHDASHAVIANNAHVPLGTVAHDNANVTGGVSGFAIPAITFTFNAGPIANGSTESGFDATSVGSGPLNAGNYTFNASVASDGNYTGATSSEEPFVVDKAQLAISTTVHDAGHNNITGGSISLGSSAHDNATVTGGVSGFAIPAITFTFNGNPIANDSTESGFDATSVSTGSLGAGNYKFNATVASNGNYTGSTSSDEPFTVNKAQLSITTVVHNAAHSDITNTHVPLGTIAHDNATVSGGVSGFAIPGISFTFNGGAIANGSTESGFDATTVPTSALGAGTYKFNATVATNANYLGATSSDEPFVVDVATPNISTVLYNAHDNSIISNGSGVPLGTSVYDTALVTDSGFPFTGSVTFQYYTGGDCTTGTLQGTQTGVAVGTQSSTKGPLGAGSYAFRAMYVAGSDTNHSDSAWSSCEPFHIDKVQLSINTTVHNAAHGVIANGAHVPLGTIAHDNANVTGGVSGFTIPAISFTFNGNPISNGSTESGFDATSVGTGALGAGSYTFNATVGSNDNYTGATSSDEPFIVDKADSNTVTEIHNSSGDVVISGPVALGTTVHDKATVSGTSFGTPTGTVDFTFFTGADCKTGGNASGTGIVLSGGIAHPSSNQGPLAAGSYSFMAHYNGDNNYNSSDGACEPLTVNTAQLGINTTVHSDNPDVALTGNLPLGGGAHDTATVTGKVGSFDFPDVTFYFFGKGVACTNGDTTGATALNTITPDSTTGVAHPSTSETNLASGTYNFMAVVAGNGNYTGATSNCEPFTVNRGTLTLSTTVHNPDHSALVVDAVLGATLHDLATVGGINSNFAPANNVTFRFYNNGACSGDGIDAGSQPIVAGVAHPSNDEGPLAAGLHAFQAFYDGSTDPNYGPDSLSSACEPFNVNKAQLAITTTVHDASHTVIANGAHVPLGTMAHDNANVTGKVTGFAIPAISFTFNGGAIANDTTETGFDATSIATSALGAGNYKFNATIAGDSNYLGATSADEPFTVDKATPLISTALKNAFNNADIANGSAIPMGTSVYDTALVTDSGFPFTGTVSFQFFTGGDCTTGSGTTQSGVTVGTQSATKGPLGAGSYAFQAMYVAGSDANHSDSAWSSCEPFHIDKVQLNVSTVVHDSSHTDKTNQMVLINSIMHDTASVSGAVSGFTAPTPTFTLTSGYTNSCANGSAVGNDSLDSGNGGFKSADSAALGAGVYAYRGAVADDANYIGGVSGCEPFTVINPHTTISIVPNTFETAPGENVILAITDTNDGSVPLTSPSVVLTYGSTTITLVKSTTPPPCTFIGGDSNNNGVMDPGEAWQWSCTIMITSDTTFTVTGHGIDPLNRDITPSNGYTTELGSTTVRVVGTTRTLGFWQTHTTFTSFIFTTIMGSSMPIGSNPHKGILTTTAQIFGGFYAPIAKTTLGVKRSPVDQARITLLQQLLAAKLNCAAFGCGATTLGQIATADADYFAGNKSAIMNDVSILDAYNNSGDTGAIPSSLPATGKATPKTSQAQADLVFWNTP